MPILDAHPPLSLVERALRGSTTRPRCPTCGRTVHADVPSQRLHGAVFHADCAGYRRAGR